jgi:hypothetical protein
VKVTGFTCLTGSSGAAHIECALHFNFSGALHFNFEMSAVFF